MDCARYCVCEDLDTPAVGEEYWEAVNPAPNIHVEMDPTFMTDWVEGYEIDPAFHLVFAGPVRWTGKKTEIGLNPTAKDRTTGCGCTNSEFFRLPVATFVDKSKNRKNPV